MRLLLTMICTGLLALPAYAASDISETAMKLKLSNDALFKMGEELFNTAGPNTCLKCHGKGGHGGDQAGAADLRHPRTWRSYQALGGDAAFSANKEKFIENMETALLYLIRNGGTTWNLKFDRTHKDITYDWSKVSVPDKADKYNNMMKGITSAPMKKRLKKVVQKALKLKKSSDARDVAAVAAFTYVKSFDDGSDKGGVFK